MAGFGVDVLDPAVTPRRIAVLLDRLPPHARRLGEPWSIEAELLALVVDHLANLTWITARAHGAKVARPRPMPRPARRPVIAEPARPAVPETRPGMRGDGTVKTGSWGDAIAMLAGMPGVTCGPRWRVIPTPV